MFQQVTVGFLSSTKNNIVHFQDACGITILHVQIAIFIHLFVGNIANHFHSTTLGKCRTMNPTRSLSQSCTQFALFALEKMYPTIVVVVVVVVGRGIIVGRLVVGFEATSNVVLLIHSPLLEKLVYTMLVALAFRLVLVVVVMQQIFCHVKSNSTGTYNRNSFSHGNLVFQNINVGQYLGVSNTRNRWCSGMYSRGENPCIKALLVVPHGCL
mmetsp:Transcript_3773/g.5628  ORF Transcript_3773/g.5628 Transcript_3773/m.5628 type:complete len:212 (-) Transcript_3773:721-1356(-)